MTMLNKNSTPKKLAIILTLPSLGGLELNLLKFFAYRIRHNNSTLLILSEGSASQTWATKEKLPHLIIGKTRKYFSLKQILELKKIISDNFVTDLLISSSQDLDLVAWTKVFSFDKKLKIHFYQQMQIGVSKKDFYHTWKFSQIDNWMTPLPWLKLEAMDKTKIHPTKFNIVPLCLDTELFSKDLGQSSQVELKKKYNIPSDSIVFGIVGRIDPGKGQLLVIQAFENIFKQFPNIYLCLIGSATLFDATALEYEKIIDDKISKLSFKEHILRFPHLHNPAHIYSLLDILVVASQKETFGMVTIEGLLSNLVVIGANSGGTTEILEHGKHGLIFEVGSVADLSNKMEQAITNLPQLKSKNSHKNFSAEYDFKRLNTFFTSN